VPPVFFETLFIGAGQEGSPGFLAVLQNIVIGPIAAFFTFIGSMGNIPLAAILFNNGVSFGGIMAFIFSDLVVFPVIRINAKYYGWKMALYILGLLFGALIATALLLHYGFSPKPGWAPPPASGLPSTIRSFSTWRFWPLPAYWPGWRLAANQRGDTAITTTAMVAAL